VPRLKGRAIAGAHDYEQIPALAERSKLRVENFYADFDAQLAAFLFVCRRNALGRGHHCAVTIEFATPVRYADSRRMGCAAALVRNDLGTSKHGGVTPMADFIGSRAVPWGLTRTRQTREMPLDRGKQSHGSARTSGRPDVP
jgi:hypothetical protein